jgi:hypothetical protein
VSKSSGADIGGGWLDETFFKDGLRRRRYKKLGQSEQKENFRDFNSSYPLRLAELSSEWPSTTPTTRMTPRSKRRVLPDSQFAFNDVQADDSKFIVTCLPSLMKVLKTLKSSSEPFLSPFTSHQISFS